MIRFLVPKRVSPLSVLVLAFAALAMTGCGALLGDSSGPAVVIAPAQANVRAGATQQFTAQVNGVAQSSAQAASLSLPHQSGTGVGKESSRTLRPGVANTTVTPTQLTWAVNDVVGGNTSFGTITSTGLYTAPAVLPSSASIKVTAATVSAQPMSGTASVSLENPVPVIQTAAPNPVTVGAFTLTVSGAQFVKGTQLLWNGVPLQSTFVSATHLTAVGTATQAEIGMITLTVKNPDPGSIVSSTSFLLQVSPPLTVAVKVSPAAAQIRDGGSQAFSATVTGSSNTAVTWSVNGVAGGNATNGTINSNGLYKAPATLPNPSSVKVTATSVADTRASGTATASLENAVPTLSSLSPSTVNVGNFSLTVNGTNFVSGAAVVFGGQLLTTHFVNGTQLTATGTATSQQVGQVQVLVQNPDPGSADSNQLAEQVSSQQEQLTASVAARFLEQASWGPTSNSIAQLQQSGFQGYLSQQFSAPVSSYKTPGPTDDLTFVQKQFFVNATQGQDQLRQRVSFALSQIMVISAFKINNPTAFSLWNNMMQKDAFGNFSTLLNDVTLSPSMGYYLDMGNNDGCTSCSPNENYAREVLQLFSIGLAELNPDGTPQLDGSGNPIPTYTQDTIEGFAHVFTGWSYPPASGQKAQFYNSPFFSGPMLPYDTHHDKGSKSLLNGVTLPAGGTIQADLDAAVQNIFTHPNVGPFISKQLIQKLVTSNPSPDYVSRVTQVFNDNGSGVRGDLKAVVTAILMDPEARRGDDPAQVQASDGHLREPLLHMMTLMRGLTTTTDGANLMYYARDMRQEPFNPTTVFNFYPPNYQIEGTPLLGPEFKILNNSTDISRINFVNSLVYGSLGSTTKADITGYVSLAPDVNKLLDAVSLNLLHGQMSDSMRSTLSSTLSTITDNKRRAQAALYLTGSSSQFQVEH